LQEALELRKFRKRAAGLDISDLNRGDRRKQKEKPVEDDPWKLKSGGGIINIDEVRGKSFGGDEKAGAGGGGSFATASNAMDTDRHMQDFIEKELRKRRGQTEDGPATESPSDAPKDFHDELFQIPDHLKTAEKAVSEGNVTLSTAMLTAIPEIDLGMSVKLKNIEETERAKRKLLDRTTGGGDDKLSSGRIGRNEFAGANAVASERCECGDNPLVSDLQVERCRDSDSRHCRLDRTEKHAAATTRGWGCTCGRG
ncbi:hepatocellular carcinoma-associated antigen 59-domain-containing protein, partial [Fimicolochytrium jonesii]|uniref:hepatocellular carcinoma-associated antigen 59-domain-containing protein n=1 Tax=Fimicolochytrium jonesii TaxID=1396493 RepID=UPI0022FDC5B1